MSIFVVINGTPVVAFNADSLFQAQRIADQAALRSDMMVSQTVAGPIWNGVDDIIVRQALPKERALWERAHNFAMQLDPTHEEVGTLEIWLVYHQSFGQ